MNEAREELLKFMGVGHKVADCVLLMSLDKVQWFSEHYGFSRMCTDIVSQSRASTLSTTRQTSTIPHIASANWVYPSKAQFFATMACKAHDPYASDMCIIVPIHNAMNEHAWVAVRG